MADPITVTYWAQVTKTSWGGYRIKIHLRYGHPLSLALIEYPYHHAWTRRGAVRRTRKILKARMKAHPQGAGLGLLVMER